MPVNRAANFYIHELMRLPPDRGLHFDHAGAWIRCPNPRHSNGMERSPSLKITVDPGKRQGQFYCFGCKELHGSWNKLAKLLNLKKVTVGGQSAHVGFSFKKFEAEESLPNFKEMIPWSPNHSWRDMGPKILAKFDTKVFALKQHGGEKIYLMFPVSVYDEYVGYIRANREKPKRDATGKKQKNYINMSGEWVQSALFGFDIARQRVALARKHGKLVVLWVVEGPRDTMNVAQHGGIVVGLIGSNVTRSKIKLILDLEPDIIIVATDNDTAGNNAAEHLMHGKFNQDTKKYEFTGIGALIDCIRLKFKGGRDPANLSKQQVHNLITKARGRIRK